MDDKERLIGLIVAPIAAAIAIMVTGALIGNDPAARLADGAVNTRHVNPSLYPRSGRCCWWWRCSCSCSP